MNVKYAVDLLREVLLECDCARARLNNLVGKESPLTEHALLVAAQRDAGLMMLGDVIGPFLAVVLPGDSRLIGRPRSISEQLSSLSKCAHALALLFNDDPGLCPSVLVHSLVVNVCSSFTLVALVAEHAAVTQTRTTCAICMAGSDCMENCISFLRRSHDTNFNLRELCGRICSGLNADEVLSRHHDWRTPSLHRDTMCGDRLRAEHVMSEFHDKAQVGPDYFDRLSTILPACWGEGRALASASFAMASPYWCNPHTANRAYVASFVGGPFSEGASLARRPDGSVIGSQSSWTSACKLPAAAVYDESVASEDAVFDDGVGEESIDDTSGGPSTIEIPPDASDEPVVALSKELRVSLQKYVSSIFGYSRHHSASRLVRVTQGNSKLLQGDVSTRGAIPVDVGASDVSDDAAVVIDERTPVAVLVKTKRGTAYYFRVAIGAVTHATVLVHSPGGRSGGAHKVKSVSVPTLSATQLQQTGVLVTVDLYELPAVKASGASVGAAAIEVRFKRHSTVTVSGQHISPLVDVVLAYVSSIPTAVEHVAAPGGVSATNFGPTLPPVAVPQSPKVYAMVAPCASILRGVV